MSIFYVFPIHDKDTDEPSCPIIGFAYDYID